MLELLLVLFRLGRVNTGLLVLLLVGAASAVLGLGVAGEMGEPAREVLARLREGEESG